MMWALVMVFIQGFNGPGGVGVDASLRYDSKEVCETAALQVKGQGATKAFCVNVDRR